MTQPDLHKLFGIDQSEPEIGPHLEQLVGVLRSAATCEGSDIHLVMDCDTAEALATYLEFAIQNCGTGEPKH